MAWRSNQGRQSWNPLLSLSFDGSVVTAFLDVVRSALNGPMVCEPRM